MPVTDPSDRRYARARGADPDDFSSILANADRFSPSALCLLLHAATTDDFTDSDIPALKALLHHRSVEIQAIALRHLDRLLGPAVASLARDLIRDPKYRDKPSALHALCRHGAPTDAPLIAETAKAHLSGRRQQWGGPTPVVVAGEFFERGDTGPEAAEFSRWLTRRWWMLSSHERKRLARHAPPAVNTPPRLLVVSTDPARAELVAADARRALPRLVWETLPFSPRDDKPALRDRLRAADAAIALDPDASRACLTIQRDEARPVIRLRHTPSPGSDALPRHLLKELAAKLEYLLAPDA